MNDYITMLDIASVTHTITRIDVTARTDTGRYLHRWLIGSYPEPEGLAPKLFWDTCAGKITVVRENINDHDTPTRHGPEIGWGLNVLTIPPALMNAPITDLAMNCADGITYELRANVTLTDLAVEMIRAELGTGEGGNYDEA